MLIHCDTTRYIWEVLEGAEYSPIFDKLVVMDLGCNIGAFSLWIYPKAKSIHAIDMDNNNLDLFRKTISDNRLENITLYQEKVADLSAFMSGHGIPVVDILKIDIEGDELTVFNNNFPKDKVRTIVGEYHDKPVQSTLEWLRDEGF